MLQVSSIIQRQRQPLSAAAYGEPPLSKSSRAASTSIPQLPTNDKRLWHSAGDDAIRLGKCSRELAPPTCEFHFRHFLYMTVPQESTVPQRISWKWVAFLSSGFLQRRDDNTPTAPIFRSLFLTALSNSLLRFIWNALGNIAMSPLPYILAHESFPKMEDNCSAIKLHSWPAFGITTLFSIASRHTAQNSTFSFVFHFCQKLECCVKWSIP